MTRTLIRVLSAVALMTFAGTAFGQGPICNTTLVPIAPGGDSNHSTNQMNSNFEALNRTVTCLQRALAISEANFRATESAFREVSLDLAELRRQVDLQEQSGTRAIVVRACQSLAADVVYLPSDIPCSTMGETYQDQRGRLPTFRVMVPIESR
jgi:hypothetical protein